MCALEIEECTKQKYLSKGSYLQLSPKAFC